MPCAGVLTDVVVSFLSCSVLAAGGPGSEPLIAGLLSTGLQCLVACPCANRV